MKAIVTIKLPKNPLHNPNQKKTGKCPVSGNVCTDVTGEHHSILVEGNNIEDITKEVKKRFSHITRIEICD
jgi:hypothetical protein